MRDYCSKVFVGNLPENIKKTEIEDLFYKYGRIRYVDLKTPSRPPAFAFVEFEDARDAEDAVRARDGYDYYGYRLRVEISRSSSRDSGYGRDRYDDRGGRGGRESNLPRYHPDVNRAKGTGFRVLVKGLPRSASWQDLKDHFRTCVRPEYTNVFQDRDGIIGVVEFSCQEDLDTAIRKLDDSEFKNPFDRSYVRLIDDSRSDARERSRSPVRRGSPPRGRSRSRSPRGDRSVSPRRGGSASPRRDASRSASRSPARGRSGSPRPRSVSPPRDD